MLKIQDTGRVDRCSVDDHYNRDVAGVIEHDI
jgi:hypothetical protein